MSLNGPTDAVTTCANTATLAISSGLLTRGLQPVRKTSHVSRNSPDMPAIARRRPREMSSCYNGVWHDLLLGGQKGKQWHLIGARLHIQGTDGAGLGDFHQATDGSWAGELSLGNGKKRVPVILDAPNVSCEQILTNKPWSYVRDTFE
jgi:hypothetical protein